MLQVCGPECYLSGNVCMDSSFRCLNLCLASLCVLGTQVPCGPYCGSAGSGGSLPHPRDRCWPVRSVFGCDVSCHQAEGRGHRARWECHMSVLNRNVVFCDTCWFRSFRLWQSGLRPCPLRWWLLCSIGNISAVSFKWGAAEIPKPGAETPTLNNGNKPIY